ncbi:MAG: hypothetical protein BJG00_009735 [Limnothrix sp. CACIAM 69d]|nr:MAG: hypothetical protein BJG00_009735 [Limnothrix sp. CACIAM 69d]
MRIGRPLSIAPWDHAPGFGGKGDRVGFVMQLAATSPRTGRGLKQRQRRAVIAKSQNPAPGPRAGRGLKHKERSREFAR